MSARVRYHFSCFVLTTGSRHVCCRWLVSHKSRISSVSAARDCKWRWYVLRV